MTRALTPFPFLLAFFTDLRNAITFQKFAFLFTHVCSVQIHNDVTIGKLMYVSSNCAYTWCGIAFYAWIQAYPSNYIRGSWDEGMRVMAHPTYL